MHGNRQNNLFGLSWQVGRSNYDMFAVPGERPMGPHDREFVHNDTIAMHGAWLKDESNSDTTEENCDWLIGPSNREMHHLSEHDVLGKARGGGTGDEG